MKFLAILLFIFTTMNNGSDSQTLYAVALGSTPVLNTPDFESVFGGTDGKTLKTDSEGLIREIEYVAFKGSVFEIIDETDKGDHAVLHVKTNEYHYRNELFIDSRFVKIQNTKPETRQKKLPSKKEIYSFLDKAVGSKYIWGGNCIEGINKLLEYYPPKENMDDKTKLEWTLKGCDCSGLMYEATSGFTERNTSKLVYEGEPVLIEGFSAKEIANKLKPLDMIVWKGHVIYVYNKITAIQSALSKGGVVKTDLIETLKHLMETRTPVNDYDAGTGEIFVVRRWYDGKL
jgi:hypothetical protein